MGKYVTKPLTDQQFKLLVDTIRNGYIDMDGKKHRPNEQMATILVLQGNLGCRIGDIVNLRTDNIEWDGEAWRLNLSEQKTHKKRYFVVPAAVKGYIDSYMSKNNITSGRLFKCTTHNVWYHLEAATKYLELHDVSSHSFRKAATIRVYNDSGKDIALTTSFLQHSTTQTTLRYLERSSKQMDEVLSKSVALF